MDDEDHDCAAFDSNANWTPVYGVEKGDSPVAPRWVELILTIVLQVACPKPLQASGRCRPILMRNDTLNNAFFYWSRGTIRYDWKYITTRSKELTDGDEAKLQSFVLGIIAHEYGHYLDDTTGRASHDLMLAAVTAKAILPRARTFSSRTLGRPRAAPEPAARRARARSDRLSPARGRALRAGAPPRRTALDHRRLGPNVW